MFSQKKRNYKWIYGCIGAILLAVIVFWIMTVFFDYGSNRAKQVNLDKEASDVQNAEDSEDTAGKIPEAKDFYQSYYLVKYDKNVVKVYFSDETGNLTELEDTSIVYETLAARDQEDFKNGIRVCNREDLNKLIMDYES